MANSNLFNSRVAGFFNRLVDMGDGSHAEQVVVAPAVASSATHSNVTSANTDTVLLAANPNRKPGSTIANDSTSILYVKLGSGASASSYRAAVDAKTTVPGVFPIPDGYLGPVYGFWASANGAARVCELS